MLESLRRWGESEGETYLGVVEHEGGGGIDWNGACVCGRVRFLTGMDLESIELRSLVVVVRRHVFLQVSGRKGLRSGLRDSSGSLKKDGSPSNRAISRHSLGRPRARDMHAYRHMFASDTVHIAGTIRAHWALGGEW